MNWGAIDIMNFAVDLHVMGLPVKLPIDMSAMNMIAIGLARCNRKVYAHSGLITRLRYLAACHR